MASSGGASGVLREDRCWRSLTSWRRGGRAAASAKKVPRQDQLMHSRAKKDVPHQRTTCSAGQSRVYTRGEREREKEREGRNRILLSEVSQGSAGREEFPSRRELQIHEQSRTRDLFANICRQRYLNYSATFISRLAPLAPLAASRRGLAAQHSIRRRSRNYVRTRRLLSDDLSHCSITSLASFCLHRSISLVIPLCFSISFILSSNN
jgi:hypothetical protein